MTDNLDLEHPLSDEQLKTLRETKGDVEATKRALKKAKRAGINTTELDKRLSDTETQVNGLLAVYGGMQ